MLLLLLCPPNVRPSYNAPKRLAACIGIICNVPALMHHPLSSNASVFVQTPYYTSTRRPRADFLFPGETITIANWIGSRLIMEQVERHNPRAFSVANLGKTRKANQRNLDRAQRKEVVPQVGYRGLFTVLFVSTGVFALFPCTF